MAIKLYFDFVSPYAYLAFERVLKEGVDVEFCPVVFAALLDAGGQLGPAEIPAKRKFLIRDCLRRAAELEVPFTFPRSHPFKPILPLRLALKAVSGDDQVRVIERMFRLAWRDGGDPSDEGEVRAALAAGGLDADGLIEKTRAPAVKAALRAHTEAAIALGVFGVPIFGVEGELVFGHDRFDDAMAVARGEDTLDPEAVRAFEARPTGVDRRSRG